MEKTYKEKAHELKALIKTVEYAARESLKDDDSEMAEDLEERLVQALDEIHYIMYENLEE